MTPGPRPTAATARGARLTCAEYFNAWTSKDSERFRAVLTDDAVWEGPTTMLVGADQCMAAFAAASRHRIELVVARTWCDGDQVLTWLDIATDGVPARPVANWMAVRNGLVARVRTTSDLIPRQVSTTT